MTSPPTRPVVAPKFGQLLLRLRDGQSRGAVSRALLKASGLHLSPTTLLHYERGAVGAPDPAILWGLARHYGADITSLLRTLVVDRVGEVAVRDVPVVIEFDADIRDMARRLSTFEPRYRDAVRELISAMTALREQPTISPTGTARTARRA